jgi:Arc/MetJ-type ribon-helix-helix transcriptional regulator
MATNERSKSYRLTPAQRAFINGLIETGIFGGKDAEVVRALLDLAIRHVIDTEYVRKHQETLERMKPKK